MHSLKRWLWAIGFACLAGIAVGVALLRDESITPFTVGPALPGLLAPSFAVRDGFAAMVYSDGAMWLWGDKNWSGEVPVPSGTRPIRFGEDNDWKKVAAGFHALIALKKDDTLWAMGSNTEGMLGVTGLQATNTFIQVGRDRDWMDIKTGVAHVMALKADGSLWCWGQNSYGQIGTGKLAKSEPPFRPLPHTNWVSFAPGAFDSHALDSEGVLWRWGLGWNTSVNEPAPWRVATNNWVTVSAGDYHLAALANDGAIWLAGANGSLIDPVVGKTNRLFRLEGENDWTEIHSGENWFVARKRNGSWWLAGDPPFDEWLPDAPSGGLFRPFPPEFQPLALHAQSNTLLFFMPDGRLWSLGHRVGMKPKQPVLERLHHSLLRLIGSSPPSSSGVAFVDQQPFLLWEENP